MYTASLITAAAVRPTSGPALGKASRSRGRADIADRQYDRRTALETAHALDAAERSFTALVQGPAPLTVDGTALGHGLPARPIDLLELRAILLHPATSCDARDHVWRDLVTRARRHGADWIIGCVGVALPGLKAVVRDRLVYLDSDSEVGTARVAGDLVTAFFHALLRADLGIHPPSRSRRGCAPCRRSNGSAAGLPSIRIRCRFHCGDRSLAPQAPKLPAHDLGG